MYFALLCPDIFN